jgi:hypothetical protein
MHKNSVAHLKNDVTADIIITNAVRQVQNMALVQGHIHGEKKNQPPGLTLSNPIFLPTTYSPALICFGR